MSPQAALLAALDRALGLPNRLSSKITKLRQGFDEKAGEHVFWIEYRCKSRRGVQVPKKPQTASAAVEKPSQKVQELLIDLMKNYINK